MVKELDVAGLEQMEHEARHPDMHLIQKAGIKYGNYRVYELEDWELSRLKLIGSNLTRPNSFDLQVKYLSALTGVPADTIDSFGMQFETNVVNILPKLPDQPYSDPAREHAIEKGLVEPED